MPFGLKQAPGVQQRWARVIMEIIRRQGLRYLSPECPAARPGGLLALGGYLDDSALGHSPSLSSWEWCLQYHSVEVCECVCDKSRWFTQFQHSLILSILLSLQALDLQFH